MKKSRFSESQIVSILKRQEAGVPVKDICREAGISDQTFYRWKAQYGGMDVHCPRGIHRKCSGIPDLY